LRGECRREGGIVHFWIFPDSGAKFLLDVTDAVGVVSGIWARGGSEGCTRGMVCLGAVVIEERRRGSFGGGRGLLRRRVMLFGDMVDIVRKD